MKKPHCLITGGSSGIGLACAREYANRGYRLTLIARREDQLDAARRGIIDTSPVGPGDVLCLPADVSDREQLEAAVQRAVDEHGVPDIVITSAGRVTPGYFTELPVEDFERTMATNYLGTVYTVKAVVPHMRDRGGNIVMIASGAGLVGIFGYTSYSPTKFALRGFAESLQAELVHHNIGVSIVFPPDTDTPQLEKENLTKPGETRMMTQAAGVWPVDRVARIIVKGVDRGRFAITPGLEITLLYRFGSLITPILQRYWRWQVKRKFPLQHQR